MRSAAYQPNRFVAASVRSRENKKESGSGATNGLLSSLVALKYLVQRWFHLAPRLVGQMRAFLPQES